MKKYKAVEYIVAIAVLVGLGFLFFLAIRELLSFLKNLNTQLVAAIIAASTTVFVSVVTVLIAKNLEKKREIENDIRKLKAPIYENLVKEALSFINDSSGTEKEKEARLAEVTAYFKQANASFVVWAGEDFIKAWGDYRNHAAKMDSLEHKPGDASALFLFEEVMFTIRKELGHKNNKLKKGDLLKIFVNDVEKHL